MSKEKLLLGVSGGLAVLAAALGIMLATSAQPSPTATNPPPDAEIRQGTPDPSSGEGERTIARAGDRLLEESGFIAGLQKEFGDEYVRRWLERTVVHLEAQALGIDVDRNDIDEELERMQIGYESEAQFYRVMKEQLGMTEPQLREDALQRLLLEGIATYNVDVTEADVEQYIQEHPEEFALQKEVRYAQVVTAGAEEARRVLQMVGEGVDFALLAKDLSLDELTAPNGGDSGWIGLKDPFLLPAIAEQLAAMAVGDISEPLQISDNRWVVLMFLGRRTIDPLDDSNVRKQLKKELALAAAPSLFDVVEKLLKKYNAVDFIEDD
jgi:foldase protein PrsA